MEVSGRKGNRDNVACKPCKDQGFSKCSDGFCGECEEYMCQKCFDTHKNWKPCRGHTFTDPEQRAKTREHNEDLEKCSKHLKELVKFYCPQHEQIGCGDCMILDHKACKVEYIPDRASTFKDSKDFKELTEGAKKCHRELKGMLTAIKGNKKQITDNNQKFVHDVNMFREEIIAYVNKLTNTMLKQGEDIMATDMKKIEELEKEGESLMTELSLLTKELESNIDKPNKLFVHSITQGPKLLRFKNDLDSIMGKNRIDSYEFRRDENIERLITECKQFGRLQKIEKDIEKVRQTKQAVQAEAKPIPQPLLERQKTCWNMTVDGEYLSYMDNGRGDVGVYVDKNEMYHRSYFEIEILSMGELGTIAIGLVPFDYPENKLPGCGPYSIGFNAGDGLLYDGNGSGIKFGPQCGEGDVIGCGVIWDFGWNVIFTRNGKKIGQREWCGFVYPAIGMHSPGESVKVILNANMPDM